MTKARDIADGVDTADIADGAISTAKLADDSINATKIDVSGNGTAGQFLSSDGDGTMTWADAGGGFDYTTVSGATPSLDVGTYNFFDNGTLTANTTLSFTNVPTEARWQYTAKNVLVSAYDLTSPTASGTFDFVGITSPNNIINVYGNPAFSPDGTRMYLTQYGGSLHQFALSPAWDVTTASLVRSVISGFSNSVAGIAVQFKDDGTKLFWADNGSNEVDEYALSTAWDISTATYTASSPTISTTGSTIYGMYFKTDGTKFYVPRANGYIYEYSMSTAWTVNTATLSNTLNISATVTSSYGVDFNADGTKMFVNDTAANLIYIYNLTTGYDTSTATYSGTSFDFSGYLDSGTPGINNIAFGDSGDYLYITQYSASPSIEKVHRLKTGIEATITLPASVQNSPAETLITKRVTYDFYTADGGTNVYIINEDII